MRIPPLKNKIMLESNNLKSGISVRRLAMCLKRGDFFGQRQLQHRYLYPSVYPSMPLRSPVYTHMAPAPPSMPTNTLVYNLHSSIHPW